MLTIQAGFLLPGKVTSSFICFPSRCICGLTPNTLILVLAGIVYCPTTLCFFAPGGIAKPRLKIGKLRSSLSNGVSEKCKPRRV